MISTVCKSFAERLPGSGTGDNLSYMQTRITFTPFPEEADASDSTGLTELGYDEVMSVVSDHGDVITGPDRSGDRVEVVIEPHDESADLDHEMGLTSEAFDDLVQIGDDVNVVKV